MTIMSNTIPLKEKLDFQQYQLVINALSNIGIEIAIPEDVVHGHENELAGAALGENEQLFKIELPVVAPLFLTDKRGGFPSRKKNYRSSLRKPMTNSYVRKKNWKSLPKKPIISSLSRKKN